MKLENLKQANLSHAIDFDGRKIRKIIFDLEHINRGWDIDKHDYKPTRRSEYVESDVIDFFEQFSYYSIVWELGRNKFEITYKNDAVIITIYQELL